MSAKAIVFQHIKSTKGKVDLKALTSEIVNAHPDSRWDHRHWTFYRASITSPKGRYAHLFTDEVKENLKMCRDKVDRHGYPPLAALQSRLHEQKALNLDGRVQQISGHDGTRQLMKRSCCLQGF